jgi:hypothetical protein
MKRLIAFAVCICFLAFGPSAMAGKPSQSGIPITQQISDSDENSLPYYIQSDGLGLYTNNLTTYKGQTTGTNSVLMANVCGSLPNGDRLLETSLDTRKVKITFDSTNAIQPGDPNYVVPAQFFGPINSTFRNMNTCTCGTGQSMYAMAANTKIFCPMHFRLNAVNYLMASDQNVQIFCSAADSSGCKDWTIDPILDPDYTSNPGKTRFNLSNLSNNANLGDYYMTFHLHVTRP